MAGRLSLDQVAFFQENGYLLYRESVFPADLFKALQAHFERALADWSEAGKSPEHMDVPHLADPRLFRWLMDERVLDLVESLIGPDIALWSSHFICKPPGVGKRVPWHEDSTYWKGRLEPMDVVTIWLAIDPATPDNGCMRVIPRTHHGSGFSAYDPVENPDHEVFDTEIRNGQFDESEAIDCILEPNQCSIHHAKLIHGSAANTSTKRRCGYTMRYMPTTVKHLSENWPDNRHQIYLARGKDRAGNCYGDPTKPNSG